MEARLRRWICRFIEAFLAVSVAALTLAAALQVGLRYLFAAPWPWMEQLSVILMIWMAWLGAAYLWLRSAHVAIDSILDLLSPAWRARACMAFDLCAVLIGGAIFIVSFETFRAFSGMELGDLPIDIAVNYQPIASGALLLAAAGGLNLWRRAAGGDAV